jgi:cytochrome b561
VNTRPLDRYDAFSRALHWVTAVVVLTAFILGPEHFGRQMHQGLDPATRADIVWHETLGCIVFVLTAIRLFWAGLRPGVPVFSVSRAMKVAGKAVQGAMWALLLLLPVTALMALGSEGHPMTLLGGFRIDRFPAITASAIAKWADWGEVHGFLGDAIMWLAGLHAVAGIYHHLVLKDGVLRAMWPR